MKRTKNHTAFNYVKSFRARDTFSHFRERIPYRRTVQGIENRPLTSFFVTLGMLLLVIVLGSYLAQPKATDEEMKAEIKTVKTFNISDTPKITLQAKVEKSGVLQIVALTNGVVNSILVTEGENVATGTTLITLGSNYNGANAAAVSSQMAHLQYTNVTETYETQKALISKQREVANQTNSNAEKMQEIARNSGDEIKSLVTLNEEILSSLDQNLQTLEANNLNGVNDQAIVQIKQGKVQIQAGLLQLRGQQRSSELQASDDKPPALLAELQKDIALKQLDIQEKALNLNKEVSYLQYQLASIQTSLTVPSSPCPGIVEKIHVKVGDVVAPGTPLATLTLSENEITAVAQAPRDLAQNISLLSPTTVQIKQETLTLYPSYVSTNATDGLLYSVFYTIPTEYNASFTNNAYVTLDVPLNTVQSAETLQLLPIDTVFQTTDKAYVFVIEGDKAVARTIALGTVNGSFVEVLSGLKKGDRVILDRTVLTGDQVKTNE